MSKETGITAKGYCILIAIGAIYIGVTIIKILTPASSEYNFLIRLFGLWGFISLSIATIMTPFLREIMKNFGKPFLKIHHLFAFSGTVFITLHPIVLAINQMTLAVFLPNFDSWLRFWELAGRPALILLYIGLVGVLFRRKLKDWRIVHALMYPMLLMGYVHGVLIGTDFQNVGILVIFTILFALSMAAFVLKRYRAYHQKQVKKQDAI